MTFEDSKHVEAVAKIQSVCKAASVVAAIHTDSLDYSKRYLKMGFNLVTLGKGHMGVAAVESTGYNQRYHWC